MGGGGVVCGGSGCEGVSGYGVKKGALTWLGVEVGRPGFRWVRSEEGS